MKKSNKLGVVITDGVGFRNFILSDFINEAKVQFDEVVVLSCLAKEAFQNIDCKVIELVVFEESSLTWFFRKLKEIAHLQRHRKGNFGIQDNFELNNTKSKSLRGKATRLAYLITNLFYSEFWIQFYFQLQCLSFKNNKISKSYNDILKQEDFSLLFFTHQRPPYIAPLIAQAYSLKIRTATFIFSWDNLASKGRMAGNFDYYLVWNPLMKSDLMQFYPSVMEDSVKEVGTPQFEPYVLERFASTQCAFFEKFNLDENLKTICFSCGDISTSKNDALYIVTVAQGIVDGRIPPINFLVRTSPAEDPYRFNDLIAAYPLIRWNFPKWIQIRENHQEAWSQRIPSIEDITDLRSILTYTDININMLSTMSLDFMLFDKPVINTVFGDGINGLYNDQRFLNYAHIINVVKSEATQIAKNKDELFRSINYYYNNPNADRAKREYLLKLQVCNSLEGTSARITRALLEWTHV